MCACSNPAPSFGQCTDVAVGSVLLDTPCPWVGTGVGACAVGVSLKGCTIAAAKLPRGEGLSVAAQVDKGVVRVATEDSEVSRVRGVGRKQWGEGVGSGRDVKRGCY